MTPNIVKEFLPILKAYSEGKTIQFKDSHMEEWMSFNELSLEDIQNFMDKHFTFRVKPNPHYVPFETKEECWEEMLKHQPFSWVSFTNKQGIRQPIISIAEDELMLDAYPDEHLIYDFKDAFEAFQFVDGTPFGKLIEE